MFPQYAITYSFGNWISTLRAVNLTILDVYTFSLKKNTLAIKMSVCRV